MPPPTILRFETPQWDTVFRVREHLNDLALVGLALSPFLVAAILGLRWLDAQQTALTEQAARLSIDAARGGADRLGSALDALIEAQAAQALQTLGEGGVGDLRFSSGAALQLFAVAGLDPVSGAPFPGPDVLPRYSEERLFEPARAVVGQTGVAWSGSAIGDRPATACVPTPPRGAVCLLIDSASLRDAARAQAAETLGSTAQLTETLTETGAPLPPPLSGWSVVAQVPPVEPRSGRALAALLAPILSFALLIAWAIRRSWRQRQAEAERRVELFAQVSHALRTPLANLRLYVDLIQRRADDPAARTRYAAVIGEETERLDGLVSDALDCARGGAIVSERAAIDATALVRRCIARIEPRLTAAGGSIRLIADDTGRVMTDARALERCLDNLLDNAVRHAPGAAVTVTLHRRAGLQVLSVADDGPGLAKGMGPRLFRSFEQGGANAQGFGLGLAACRALARAAGGDIVARSPDRGAQFDLTLPATPAGPQVPPCAS